MASGSSLKPNYILFISTIYILTLCGITYAQKSTCIYPDILNFPTAHVHPTFTRQQFDVDCIVTHNFTAYIKNDTLLVNNCPTGTPIKWRSSHNIGAWMAYTGPQHVDQSVKFAYVVCGDSKPLYVIRQADVAPKTTLLNSKKAMNVFVVMVDALSYEGLHRALPRTSQFLQGQHKRSIVDFSKYVAIGLNSNPNKFQLFGGYNYTHFARDERDGVPSNITWIWEEAKQLGYATAIIEGGCPPSYHSWAEFNVPIQGKPIKSIGHHEIPDYVLLEELCANTRTHENYCIEGKWGHKHASEYITSLVDDMALIPEEDRAPLFLWSNFVEAHTAPQWGTAVIDDDIAEFLEYLMNSPLMDNGVILFLSDHGSHFGYYPYNSIFGMAENRHPFLYMMTKSDLISKQVLSNSQQMVTPMDMYKTMRSLMGLQWPGPNKRHWQFQAIDILNEQIPVSRTCADAGVTAQRCLCTHTTENNGVAIADHSSHDNTKANSDGRVDYSKCDHAGVPDYMWSLCVETFAHPSVFDWQYYLGVIEPIVGADKVEHTECYAVTHWCGYGLSLGLNSTSTFSLMNYLKTTPVIQDTSFCFSWPATYDCRWSMILYNYVTSRFDPSVPSPHPHTSEYI